MPSWDDSLNIGIAEIDTQHKELFHRVKLFQEACREGYHVDDLADLLDFLKRYASEHFDSEERYFKYSPIEQANNHEQHHKDFIVQLEKISEQLELDGPNMPVAMDLNHVLMDYLLRHIRVDKVFFSKVMDEHGSTPGISQP